MEYFITYFAVAQLGLIVVPLNIRLSASELAYQIEDSGAKAILYEKEQEPLYNQLNQLVSFESAHIFEESYSTFNAETDQNDFE